MAQVNKTAHENLERIKDDIGMAYKYFEKN
jgi:hypothetical protein